MNFDTLTTTTTTSASPIQPSRLLSAKLRAVRHKRAMVGFVSALAVAVLIVVTGLAVAMMLDWWMDLPRLARAGALLAIVAAASHALWRLWLKPVLAQPNDDSLALLVEKQFPQFRTRLIAAVQLSRPGALDPDTDPDLVRSLIQQTEQLARMLDFTTVIPTQAMTRRVLLAVLAVVVGLGLCTQGGQASADLLRRALLANVPVPRNTSVLCLSGDRRVARGETVHLEARAGGLIPTAGCVTVRDEHGRSRSFTMPAAADDPTRFVLAVQNVQQSFTYTITLNDASTGPHRIEVRPPPVVTSVECQQVYPDYTKLGRVKRSLADLQVLAGSRLELCVTTSRPLRHAAVRLVGLNGETQDGLATAATVPLTVLAADPHQATGSVVVAAAQFQGIAIHLVDDEGLESQNDPVYRLDVTRDKPPVVKITYPDHKVQLVTRRARLLIGMDATDDFAIRSVTVHYKMASVDTSLVQQVELDFRGESPTRLRQRLECDLGELPLPLTEGQIIEYWLEVRDNNDVTGPGISTSEHYWARVVTETEKQADLHARMASCLDNIRDVAHNQHKLNEWLGKLISQQMRP